MARCVVLFTCQMDDAIFQAVSLFSNCGAGDAGYRKAGLRFEVMAELDERRLDVCLLNHAGDRGVPGDLRRTWPLVIGAFRKKAKGVRPAFLAACPPCQGLSSARHDRGLEQDADAGCKDKRNLLVTVIAEVVADLQPRIVVVENVQAFLTRKIRHPKTRRPISAASYLIDELNDAYEVFPILADLCDFGVPQSRKRTFLTFIRKDMPQLDWLITSGRTPYPSPSFAADHGGTPITIMDALAGLGLPSLDAADEESPRHRSAAGCMPCRFGIIGATRWSRRFPPTLGGAAGRTTSAARCGRVNAPETAAVCPGCCGPLLALSLRQETASTGLSMDSVPRRTRGFIQSTRRPRSRPPAGMSAAITQSIPARIDYLVRWSVLGYKRYRPVSNGVML